MYKQDLENTWMKPNLLLLLLPPILGALSSVPSSLCAYTVVLAQDTGQGSKPSQALQWPALTVRQSLQCLPFA